MNIFFLDKDPKIAAQSLHNKHCNKMLIEACQLLSNVHHHCKDDFSNWSDYVFHRADPYAKTHFNHPCSIWARTSIDNYLWLLQHALEMSDEYTRRYNKTHKCYNVLTYFSCNAHQITIPSLGLTQPALAMPDQYKINSNTLDAAVESYRAYYIAEKCYDSNSQRMDKYTYRQRPNWFKVPKCI